MKNLFKFVFAALTVAMLSTACGGAKEEAPAADATEAAAPAEEAAPAAEEAAPAADTTAAPAAEAAPAEAAH
jgi:hypothetical protein